MKPNMALWELRIRLDERKMCVFHKLDWGCTCFHCRRQEELMAKIEKLSRRA